MNKCFKPRAGIHARSLRILWIATLAAAFAACKKDPQKHNRYSNWTVNGQQFRSNNVEAYLGDARHSGSSLSCRENGNGFNLGFHGSLPATGSWPLKYGDYRQGDYFLGIAFYVDTMYYILSPHTTNYLTAGENDGKAFYHMPPTWFQYYYNHSDSVQITGTFSEP